MAEVLEKTLYETDYYAWTQAQAAELRRLAAARINSTLDLENLAEEVESLGRSELATVRSQLRRIIEHLLKLEYSPAANPRAEWRHSVVQARDEVEDHLTAAMRADVEAAFAKDYQRARRDVSFSLDKHGEREAAKALPKACPYQLDQIVTHGWWPTNRHGLVDDQLEP
jgi:hypothetical protein